MASAADNLAEWFTFIWKDTVGVVRVPHKPKSGEWTEKFFNWPKSKDAVVSYCLKHAANGDEVYYCPTIFDRASAKKQYALGTWVLWADFDGNAPEVWTGAQEPSYRVRSSSESNQHTYWALDAFATDVEEIENRNRTIAYAYSADTSGWDINQLLRPPYTTNFGYAKPDRKGQSHEVIVEEISDRTYQFDSFKRTDKFQYLVMDNLGDIPSVSIVLAELSWPKQFLELFAKSADELGYKSDGSGRRSDALQQLAYFAAESGGTDEQVYAIVSDANERWGKYPKTRTDAHKRLVDIVERARTKHPFGLSDFSGLVGSIATQNAEDSKTVYGFKEFMATDIEIEWLLEGLMSMGGLGLIVGSPGVGKTQLGIRMAMAIAEGKSFLHWENKIGPKKVLFTSFEMNHPSLKHLLSAMKDLSDKQTQTFESNLRIYPSGQGIPFDSPEGRQYLEALIQAEKPDVLFVDSLGESTSRSLSDDDSVRELTKYVAYLRRQYNLTIYFVHHNRKSQVKGQVGDTLDDTYGSRYLTSAVDFVLNMTENQDGIKLTIAKQRLAMAPPPYIVHRTPELNFELVGELDGFSQSSFTGITGVGSFGLFGNQ